MIDEIRKINERRNELTQMFVSGKILQGRYNEEIEKLDSEINAWESSWDNSLFDKKPNKEKAIKIGSTRLTVNKIDGFQEIFDQSGLVIFYDGQWISAEIKVYAERQEAIKKLDEILGV